MDSIHQRVKSLLYSLTGITLSQNKGVMIDNRLQKLLRDIPYDGDVSELLSKIEEGSYVKEFINSFTTNKTHFFREDFHFIDLRDRILPEFIKNNQEIQVYCSASSTGEEPYSIAITISEAAELYKSSIAASIIATDIDTNVLDYAKNGIYNYNKAQKELPDRIIPQKYFKRRVTKTLLGEEILIKVKDNIKNMIKFDINNLSDDEYPFQKNQFDVIFCRNVLIYFSVEDQNAILKKLFKYLKVGGTLYIGHSENLHDLAPFMKRVAQNSFIKLKEI
jgi:chemotaxis protein methyltransferase CheR